MDSGRLETADGGGGPLDANEKASTHDAHCGGVYTNLFSLTLT